MATTTTQSPGPASLAGGPPTTRSKSRVSVAGAAFLAILNCDIVVTGRDFIAFLLQVLLQPLFFLFIFGKVLPGIGFARQGFAAYCCPVSRP